MLETIVEAISSEVLERILDKFANQMTGDLDDRIQSLEEDLHGIERKVERQLAVHLKAGFTFLKMGDLQNARTEFVRAEAADPYAATAKLWLSAMLFKDGQWDFAMKMCRRALLLNPFVGYHPSSYSNLFSATHSNVKLQLRSEIWSLQLKDKRFVDKFLKQPLLKTWLKALKAEFSSKFAYRSQVAVRKVSCSGGNPVVFWRLGSDLLTEYEEIVSAFELANGKCLWNKFVRKEELCFATPLLVVLKSKEPAGGYELIDLQTGKRMAKMGTEYYKTVFCPNESYLYQVEPYEKSNVTMTDSIAAEARSRDDSRKDAFIVAIFDHDTIPFEESRTCSDPFGGNHFEICVTNVWQHLHYMGSAHDFPACGLGCDARLVACNRKAIENGTRLTD
jgi:tetratricopeptide (TPR) repeat protein